MTVGSADSEHLLFYTRNSTPLTTNNVRRRLRAVLEAAGIEGVTPHSFRRTVATYLDRAGGADLAAEMLGHTSSRITKVVSRSMHSCADVYPRRLNSSAASSRSRSSREACSFIASRYSGEGTYQQRLGLEHGAGVLVGAGQKSFGGVVEPVGFEPVQAAHLLRDPPDLGRGHEQGIDVTGEPVGVVGQRHRSPADHEQLRRQSGLGEQVGQLSE